MKNTVRIDLLEFQGKELMHKGIFNAPGNDSQDIHWITNHHVQRLATNDPPLPFAKLVEGKERKVVTRGLLEIVSQESKNQLNHKTYTKSLRHEDWLKRNCNSFYALIIGSSKVLIKIAQSLTWSCRISHCIYDSYEIS